MKKWDELKMIINEKKSFRLNELPSNSYSYVNYLRASGFLTRTKRGYYSLNIQLDERHTLKEILSYAYGDKKGQINQLIRKEKLKEINEKTEH